MDLVSVVSTPLVPVRLKTENEVVVLSVRDLIVRSHDVIELDIEELQKVAFFRRLLLAIVLSVYGRPRDIEEWRKRFDAGRFDPGPLDVYLATHAHRFFLFDPEEPFDQVGGLEALSGEIKSAALIVPAIATGNNVPLFSNLTEADPPSLSLSEAFLSLLAVHAWDTAAIKTGAVGDQQAKAGKTAGNPTGPLGSLGVVLPQGSTLFDTVLLNTPIAEESENAPQDAPWWLRPAENANWKTRQPSGLLDQLTFQSRRVRLFPEVAADGSIVVRGVIVAAGDRIALLDHNLELHSRWSPVRKPRAGDPSHRPIRHGSGSYGWQGLNSLLAVDTKGDNEVTTSQLLTQIGNLRSYGALPPDYPLNLLLVGVEYGNKSAVIENVIVDRLALPVVALSSESSELRHELLQIAEQAESLRKALNRFGDDLRRTYAARPIPWDKGDRPGDRVLAEFSPIIRSLLRKLGREPERVDDLVLDWEVQARDIVLTAADRLVGHITPRLILGVTPKDTDWHYQISSAESVFKKSVRKALPRITDQERRSRQTAVAAADDSIVASTSGGRG